MDGLCWTAETDMTHPHLCAHARAVETGSATFLRHTHYTSHAHAPADSTATAAWQHCITNALYLDTVMLGAHFALQPSDRGASLQCADDVISDTRRSLVLARSSTTKPIFSRTIQSRPCSRMRAKCMATATSLARLARPIRDSPGCSAKCAPSIRLRLWSQNRYKITMRFQNRASDLALPDTELACKTRTREFETARVIDNFVRDLRP